MDGDVGRIGPICANGATRPIGHIGPFGPITNNDMNTNTNNNTYKNTDASTDTNTNTNTNTSTNTFKHRHTRVEGEKVGVEAQD